MIFTFTATSLRGSSKCRIQRTQLYSGITCLKMPVDFCCGCIPLRFPCRQFTAQQTYFSNPAGKTLSGHYIQFNFRHIQPAAMLWGIMNLQPFNDAPRFFCRIAFVQRSRFMCIEVIITGMIFSASGYMTSDRYLISSAQSTAVRCSRTLT